MNTLLNNFCNLSCDYCFANKVIEEEKQELKEIDKVIDFHKRSNKRQMRFIGGEPTLHSNFSEILLKAARNNMDIHVFTNGLYNSEYNYLFKLLDKEVNVSLLINYNKGKQKESNLHQLKEYGVNFSLGINFYKENQDYNYIIDTSKKYNLNRIRWSLVVPNSEEKKKKPAQYFKRHIPNIKQFIIDCEKNGINPHVDCNNIPICLMDEDALRLISMISENNLRSSTCDPVIDIKPNLDSIRCFAVGEQKVNIKDFRDEKELIDHFNRNIQREHLFDECENCPTYKVKGKSCGCLAYREGVKK